MLTIDVGDHDITDQLQYVSNNTGSEVVSQCSKRQPTTSLLTTEAGYVVAVMAAQESLVGSIVDRSLLLIIHYWNQ